MKTKAKRPTKDIYIYILGEGKASDLFAIGIVMG